MTLAVWTPTLHSDWYDRWRWRHDSSSIIFCPLPTIIDLRVRVGKDDLLSHDALLKISQQALQNRLIIPRDAPDPAQNSFVWLRIRPMNRPEEGLEYEFHDPLDRELVSCYAVFIRIMAFERERALLYELVATESFPGKRAVRIAENFMRLAGIQDLLVQDVSTIPSCCKGSVLTSLHVYTALTSGKSWYQEHGASSKVNPSLFQHLLRVHEIDDMWTEFLCSKEPCYFVHGIKRYLSFVDTMTRYTYVRHSQQQAHDLACEFLRTLTIRKFLRALHHSLVKFPDTLYRLREATRVVQRQLESAHCKVGDSLGKLLHTATVSGRKAVPSHNHVDELTVRLATCTLSECKASIDPPCKTAHDRMHELRAVCVGNEYFNYQIDNGRSAFLQYIFCVLGQAKGQPTWQSLAFSFFVLASFWRKSKDFMAKPLTSLDLLSLQTVMGKQRPRNAHYPMAEFNALTYLVHRSFVSVIEERSSSPVSKKQIVNKGNQADLQKWLATYDEIVIDDVPETLVRVWDYLKLLRLDVFAAISPSLVANWRRYVFIADSESRQPQGIATQTVPQPSNAMPANATFFDVLTRLVDRPDLLNAVEEELLQNSFKYLAVCFGNYLDTTQQPSNKERYKSTFDLFMLSKFIVRNSDWQTFSLRK